MVQNIKDTDRIVVDLEMLQIDFNEQKKNALRQEIANKYGLPLRNVEVNFKPVTVDEQGNKISLAAEVRDNVQDAGHQKEMMKHYIKLKNYEDINWDEIDAIDNQVNAYIDFDQYTKYKNYKFKYVKWSNYLSYGEDNYFDFTKLHGLVLLNSEPANQGGKTTFAIDLLRFALFGKADKSPNLNSVFNTFKPEATTALVEAGIEIEGVDYVIRRTIKRPALSKRTAKSKCKQTLEYFRKVGDDLELIENCEGESVQQTNNIIKDAVGDVDDFNLVISATNYSLGELLRMGSTDKGRLFSRWLGLLSIEKKEEIAKKIWKDSYSKKLLSNTYNKESLLGEINDFNEYNLAIENDIKLANNTLNTANENIIKYNNAKNDIIGQIKPVMDNLDTIDVATLDNNTENYNIELASKRSQFQQLKDRYAEVKDTTFNQDDVDAIDKDINTLMEKVSEINGANVALKSQIKWLKDDNQRIRDLMQLGVCATCGHKIDSNEQQLLIDANDEKIDAFIQEGVSNKNKLDELNKSIQVKKDERATLIENSQKVTEKAKIELTLTALKTNIEMLKLQIKNNLETKEKIATNEENIRFNSELRAKALVIDGSIENETNVKETKIREIEGFNNRIKSNNNEIQLRQDIVNKLVLEETLIRNWSLYLELVGKNGIIKLVLKDALPIINNEIARILNGLCDFETRLEVDEKNDVVINLIKKNGVVMDMGVAASGFEGTMASLALRSALASISSISKPNFLTLDEILSGVAAVNYEHVHELYKRMAVNYDFIINITHNELIYDWHNQNITVTKQDDISSINFNE